MPVAKSAKDLEGQKGTTKTETEAKVINPVERSAWNESKH